MNSAWKAFAKIKQILRSRSYPLRSRLKLFEAVVTPTALYGCESWTLNVSVGDKLKVTWRRMIRQIFQIPRNGDESWVEYIKRATARVESQCAELGFHNWATMQPSRKIKFSEKVISGCRNKGSHRLLRWSPWFRNNVARNVGRPCMRWSDAVDHLLH